MSHTNSTTNYSLPQFVGSDTPGWLTDVNGAMADIDAAIYARQQGVAANANSITSLDSRLTSVEGTAAGTAGAIATLTNRVTDAETDIDNLETNVGNNTSSISALSTLTASIQAKLPRIVTMTLTAADWSGSAYTIADALVTANSIIRLGLTGSPSANEIEAFQSANIVPGVITAGNGFTILASESVPTVDINIVYTREEAV